MNIQRQKLFKEGRRACFGSQYQGTVHHGEAVMGVACIVHLQAGGSMLSWLFTFHVVWDWMQYAPAISLHLPISSNVIYIIPHDHA